jgi:glycosyltransferase involved in cell wall biosynthesis
LTFVWVGLRDRPDLVAGFHLLLNGLVAQWLARASGAKAMYFCVGGPAEVLGGGIDSENRLFQRLGTPWPTAERMLLESVRGFDMIITMGSRARAYFLEQGFRGAIHVVPGGIDATVYQPRRALPEYDLIFVGRLVPIKRVDVFLRCVQILVAQRPALRAVIVGEGPLLPELQALAAQLGVASHVHFAGKHQDVSAWLNRARLFMLTSDSEGLSLALMEAMLCGLPAVVSNVGDLPDLVRSGENGYLVSSREPQAFADCALNVLADVDAGGAMAARARELAHEHELQACTFRWDRILPGV